MKDAVSLTVPSTALFPGDWERWDWAGEGDGEVEPAVTFTARSYLLHLARWPDT